MTLIFDRTAALENRAVMHAFIAGVSEYDHLPEHDGVPKPRLYNMHKLDAPARSAAAMAAWLYENRDRFDKPLASIRFLASPAPGEGADVDNALNVINGWPGTYGPASLDAFSQGVNDWRIACGLRPDNASFFYFAGHGLQRHDGPILTLSDFGAPGMGRFAKSVRFQNVRSGMAPSEEFPDIARTQYYFVDTCRSNVSDVEGLTTTATDVFDTVPKVDDRTAPVFYAAYPGSVAIARRGGQTEFLPILLEAFSSAAEFDPDSNRWGVDVGAVADMVEKLKRLGKLGGTASVDGYGSAILLWLASAPEVRFSVRVSPDAAIATTQVELVSLNDGAATQIVASEPDHPYQTKVPIGIYKISADSGRADLKPYRRNLPIRYKTETLPINLEAAHGA